MCRQDGGGVDGPPITPCLKCLEVLARLPVPPPSLLFQGLTLAVRTHPAAHTAGPRCQGLHTAPLGATLTQVPQVPPQGWDQAEVWALHYSPAA